MSTIVDDLWSGLGDIGFHVTDSRRWGQSRDNGLTPAERFFIILGNQIPPRHSKNVRMITKNGKGAFLYALTSADAHFWGVSAAIISNLVAPHHSIMKTNMPVPWAIVLLDGNWRAGYWFDSATVIKLRRSWRQRNSPQGDEMIYYVGGSAMRCREDTAESKRFLSSNTLHALLTELLDDGENPSEKTALHLQRPAVQVNMINSNR